MDLSQLFTLKKDQLIALDPKDAQFFINDEGFVHIASELGSFWKFDYEAAEQGRVGYHALLKSLLHSDGFFVSRILLQYLNILALIAWQMVYRYGYFGLPTPKWVAGIPDGATVLGEKVAELLGARYAKMEKDGSGKIRLITQLPPFSTLLLVEDFCTQGTGFKEAVKDILNQQPFVTILPYELVMLNRGGLSHILVEGVGPFMILPVANYRIADWDSKSKDGCLLCKMGSRVIKPKETDENWRIITTSQLP